MLNTLLRTGAGTNPGRQRENNEDALLCEPEAGIFAAIDGVGGYAGGEVASAEARDVILRRLRHRTGTPEERLREAVTNANNKIYWRSREDPELFGMACVLTVALLEEEHLYIAHVGDTRLYKIRGHHIHKLTRDHSFVGIQEDRQELTEYEAMHHPRRNEILRDVGSDLHEPDDEHFIDIIEAPFEPDSALLLCTDGLTDLVPSRTLLRVIHEQAGHPEATVEVLIDAANEAGGTDNITVVVIEGARFGQAHTEVPARPIPLLAEPPTTPTLPINLPPPAEETSPTVAPPNAATTAAVRATHASPQPIAHAPPYAETPAPPLSSWLYFAYGMATVLVLAASAYAVWALWLSRPTTQATPPPIASDLSGIINGLLDQARPGDTVTVPPGLYRETIHLRDGVTLRSARPGAARLLPPPTGTAFSDDTVAVRAEDITDAALIGFSIERDTIAGATPDAFAIGILARNATLRVDSTTITGTTRAAIDLDAGAASSHEVVIQYSTLSNNAGAGVIARGNPGALRLLGNTIRSNGQAGVMLQDPAGSDLRDNTILDNGGSAIEIYLDTTLARLRRMNTLRDSLQERQAQDVRLIAPTNNPP